MVNQTEELPPAMSGKLGRGQLEEEIGSGVEVQRRALIRQGVLLGDGGLLVVAGEGLVHHLFVRLGGKQADHRHDDEPGHHGKGAAVDGGLE